MATYPSNVLVKGDVINEVDVVDQNDHNILKGEIIALQTYIGTNPHGSRNNLTDRLATMMATNGAIAQSNGFPTSTYEGQLTWRPDLFTAYVYSSSQAGWQSLGQSLSNILFSFSQPLFGMVQPTFPAATSTYLFSRFKKFSGVTRADFHLYYVSSSTLQISASIGSSSVTVTTNSGSASIWSTLSIDVSNYTNGSLYDIVIQGNSGGGGSVLKAISLIGN